MSNTLGAISRRIYPRFGWKVTLTFSLALLSSFLLYNEHTGSIAGLFSLLLFGLVFLLKTGRHGNWHFEWFNCVPIVLCFSLLYQPTWLNISLSWLVIAHTALHTGNRRASNGLLNIGATLDLALMSPLNLVRSLKQYFRLGHRRYVPPSANSLQIIMIPVLLGFIFLMLFAIANPIFDKALRQIDLMVLVQYLSVGQILFFVVSFSLIWALVRPRLTGNWRETETEIANDLKLLDGYFSVVSLLLSLIFFNVLFALQNLTDMIYLWSEATLPPDLTFADYAHRGAYPLIVTALLAAGYVLLALQPGTPASEHRGIRILIVLWIMQNIMLVISSIDRTLIYIDTYALTLLRLSALIWMGLVAIGLALIIWRMVRHRSATWLINTNVASALCVLIASSFLDLPRIVADFNVRQAAKESSVSWALDLDYLEELGPSAIPSMDWLLARNLTTSEHEMIALARERSANSLEASQNDWRGWTVRKALIEANTGHPH